MSRPLPGALLAQHSWIGVTVTAIERHTPTIVELELRSSNGDMLPKFSAGAHIDIEAPSGAVRQYSLCGCPREGDAYRVAILNVPDSRGGSRAMHEQVFVGSTLRIGAPRNLFALEPSAQYCLLLGGGIGITPMLAMAEELAARGLPFEFHYSTRSAAHAAFLSRLGTATYASQVRLHHDDRVPLDLDKLLSQAPLSTHLYVCGPAPYMAWVIDTARARGWPEARIHREYFGAQPAPEPAGEVGFELVLARSGGRVLVAPSQSAAAALIAAGIALPLSCEQGVCGTCITRVLEGTPEHRDMFLTNEERISNDCFTPCCSRSLSPTLVLDL